MEILVPKSNQKLRGEVIRRNLRDTIQTGLDYEVQYLVSRLFEGTMV